MRKNILTLALLTLSLKLCAECVPAREIISLPEGIRPGYHQRIHPSGDYIIASDMDGVNGSRVSIIDITARDKCLEELLEKEKDSKSVWVVVEKRIKLKFSTFNSVKSNQKYCKKIDSEKAASLYNLGLVTNKVYFDNLAKCAKLYGSEVCPAAIIKTRMKNEAYPVEGDWKFISSPYDVKGMGYYHFESVLKNGIKQESSFDDPEHNEYYHSSAQLKPTEENKVVFRTLRYRNNAYKDYEVIFNNDKISSVKMSETKFACKNIDSNLSSLILSKDAKYISSNHSGTTQILRHYDDDDRCEVIADLGYATPKVSFSYPENGNQVTFQYSDQLEIDGHMRRLKGVMVYDIDNNKTMRVSNIDDMYPGYPGFTRDGRVVFHDIGKNRIVRVDPNQLNPDGSIKEDKSHCIQKKSSKPSSSFRFFNPDSQKTNTTAE